MASTFTPALRAEQVGIGDQVDTWGLTRNATDRDVWEQAIAGLVAISMPNANLTLTVANNAPDQSRPAILSFTSGVALTAKRDVIVPSGAGVTKLWVVRNVTTGGQALRVKTAAGTGIDVPNGQTRLVYCDGTNVLSTVTGAPAWTVDAGLVVTAGGLSVVAGGAAIVGNSTVTGNLAVSGDLSAATLSGGASASVLPVGTLRHSAGFSGDAGWLFCAGQAVSRTTYAALFAKMCRILTVDTTSGTAVLTGVGLNNLFFRNGMPISGPGIPPGTTITGAGSATSIPISANATASAVGVEVVVAPWGVGDGVTTFNVPDLRGCVLAGQDSMGAGAANRITVAGSNLDGLRLGARGGDQLMAAHIHPVVDLGHGHVIIDPGHGHPLNDPGHVHGNAGSGVNVAFANAGTFFINPEPTGGVNYIGYGGLPHTDPNGSGISVVAGGTNVSVQPSFTGITVGVTGAGTAANVQPTGICLIMVKH